MRVGTPRIEIGRINAATKMNTTSISIAPAHNQPALSKGQKAFNALIKQIEKRRATLTEWEAFGPAFQQKYVDQLLPRIQQMNDLRLKMAYRFDEVAERKSITQSEQRTLSKLIEELTGRCLADSDDEAIKALHNKHSGFDYDTERAAEFEDMQMMLESMLGGNSADLDLSSPEQVLDLLYERMGGDADATLASASHAQTAQPDAKKTSRKQAAAEARREEEEAQLSRSIREVYRKLASALHPDRETDPQERERKTALMQQANEAYSKNNLLRLLELQLELEHIDQHALGNLSEERLKHYNKILKEQVRELDDEIRFVEMEFKERYGLNPFARSTPKTAMRDLTREIVDIQYRIASMERDFRTFESVTVLRAWLRDVERQGRAFSLSGGEPY